MASVLAAMEVDAVTSWAERESLTRVLIAEYQKTGSPFWAAVLIVAFCPMLHRLRGRIRGDDLDSDDLDQMVIVEFLRSVAAFSSVKTPEFVALRLRQKTQRKVFQAMGRERAQRHLTDRLRLLAQEGEGNECCEDLLFSEEESPRRALVRVFDSHWPQIPPTTRLVIFATVIHKESLRRYVERITDVSEARERVYRRLQRRRTRVFEQLRKSLEQEIDRPAEAEIPGDLKRASGVER
jgi:hypothetical protein